jgi:hypothetical protein
LRPLDALSGFGYRPEDSEDDEDVPLSLSMALVSHELWEWAR